jgi:hypothetical protein
MSSSGITKIDPWGLHVDEDDFTVASTISMVDEEQTEDLQMPLAAHVAKNQQFISSSIEHGAWEAKDASGPHASYGRKKVTRPTASKMCSIALHPGLYRTDCVGDLGGARAFAEALGVSQRIPDFAERVRMAISERFVKRLQRSWAALSSHVPAAAVSMFLSGLVCMIANALGVSVDPDVKVPFAVGGYLALDNFAVIGQSDLLYRANADGRAVLTIHVECDKNFPAEQLWFHNSRGAQLYGALLVCGRRIEPDR